MSANTASQKPHEKLIMRPYGLESTVSEGPDVADIQAQARKGCIGQLAAEGGDFRSYTRSTAGRAATRRTIKRGVRRAGRDEVARTLRDD
jgi:hypothetical protein